MELDVTVAEGPFAKLVEQLLAQIKNRMRPTKQGRIQI
jgi:hypothetical protein